jgi:DNA-binding GntR family transcriptional regulator
MLSIMSLEDRSSRIDHERPIWPQVAADIERDIRSGALAAGARLPTEDELAAQYGVARNTVRRAVEDLRERGLLETFHGRGTYVASLARPEG